MTELKQFGFVISGHANVLIHDGSDSELLALRAEYGARSGGLFRRREYLLVDKEGQPLVRIRREARSEHADSVPDGGALVWASRFQTRYRIALSNGVTWFVQVPLFTEKLCLSSTGTQWTVAIEVVRKNRWRVFLSPSDDEATFLGALALIFTERWNSSYGAGHWQMARWRGNRVAEPSEALV